MLAVKILFLACSVAVCHSVEEYVFDVSESAANFMNCDTNGDKQLTLVEFKTYLKAGGSKKTTLKRNPSEEEYNAIFNLLDVTNDHTLDEREWAVGHTLYLEYSHYDENKDQLIDANELVNLFNAPKGGPAGTDIAFVEWLGRIVNDVKLHYK